MSGAPDTEDPAERRRRLARERTQACRERKREGVVLVTIPISIDAARELLLDSGHLKEWDCEDSDAIIKAYLDLIDGLSPASLKL